MSSMRCFSVWLTPEEYAALSAEAAGQEVTMSKLVRQEVGVLRELAPARGFTERVPRGYGPDFGKPWSPPPVTPGPRKY